LTEKVDIVGCGEERRLIILQKALHAQVYKFASFDCLENMWSWVPGVFSQLWAIEFEENE